MKTFKLDESGDLIFDGRDLQETEETEEVLQSLKTRLLIRLGEFFLDEFIGLSWENIFTKPFIEENARADIIECLSQDSRVQSVDDLVFNIEGRKLTVMIKLTLTIGQEIDLEEVTLIA